MLCRLQPCRSACTPIHPQSRCWMGVNDETRCVREERTHVLWNFHTFLFSSWYTASTHAFLAVPSPSCSLSSSSSSSWTMDPSTLALASLRPRYTRSLSCELRNWVLFTPKTKDMASMRLDFPAPFGPITEVKFLNGPIVWWPLQWIWIVFLRRGISKFTCTTWSHILLSAPKASQSTASTRRYEVAD